MTAPDRSNMPRRPGASNLSHEPGSDPPAVSAPIASTTSNLSHGPGADEAPPPPPFEPPAAPSPPRSFWWRLDAWWRADAPPTRLAALRLLVGGFATIYLAARLVHLVSFIDFSARHFQPIGVVSVLSAPLPPVLVVGLVMLSLPLALAFTLGWRFVITGPAFAAVLLWVLTYRNSWGMIFHTENLLVLHVLVLGVTRAADAWSLDARRDPDAAAHNPHAHGWPVRLLAVITLATYVLAGVAKLRLSGLTWVGSDLLRNYIAYDNLRKLELGDAYSPLGAALVRQGWLFPPLAAASLALELLAPLALLGPRLARVWSLAAWGFHVGVLAVMAIFFPYPLFGFAFAPLFAVERLPLWRWLRVQRPGPAPETA